MSDNFDRIQSTDAMIGAMTGGDIDHKNRAASASLCTPVQKQRRVLCPPRRSGSP